MQGSPDSHDGLVRLVLEVPVPESIELGAHLFEFFFSGANLSHGIDCFPE